MDNVLILGTVESGGYRFDYYRYVPDLEPDLEATYPLHLPLSGQVELQRQGLECNGPWGVDIYRSSSSSSFTPEETRVWAHALLAAADLADRFNVDGQN